MGNMLINRRVEDAIGVSSDSDGGKEKQEEYRIFPDHMYKGPKKLGDPHFRGLSKMEEDPMVPQRMRDIARTQLCTAEVDTFSKCSRTAGFGFVYKCRPERDELVSCINKWFTSSEFRDRVILEYLNERSHFRETGIKTKRYEHGTYVKRDYDRDGPSLDSQGKYRPQRPTKWDESYPDGPPSWTDYDYNSM